MFCLFAYSQLSEECNNLEIVIIDNPAPHLEKIKTFMDETLEKHGHAPLGVGWRSRENQFLRFDQFRRIFEGREEPFSLHDLGCGLGGLYEWATEYQLPISRYVGYDISERMVADARGLHKSDNVHFVQSPTLTEVADFSIACGIFNTRLDESEEAWSEYMREVVRNLAEKSSLGFAFNSLTTYVDWREPHLFYADPIEWFDWCKKDISPRVALLHDTPLYEWTMIVRL